MSVKWKMKMGLWVGVKGCRSWDGDGDDGVYCILCAEIPFCVARGFSFPYFHFYASSDMQPLPISLFAFCHQY